MSYRLLQRTSLLLIAVVMMSFMAIATFIAPVGHASAAQLTVQKCQKRQFLGLNPWYSYLPDSQFGPRSPDDQVKDCDLNCFNLTDQGSSPDNPCGDGKSDIPLVLLAVIDDLLRIAGIVSVAFVLYGAYQYVASQGEAERTARAQTTIINALVGLALALTAVTIVSFLGKRFGG